MGMHFIVYAKKELAKLDQEKRIKLKTAIMHVLHNDPDVRKMIKAKTQATYKALAKA
jgi:hypothetical protein